MSSEDEPTSPSEYFGTPEDRLAQQGIVVVQSSLCISKEELSQFQHFYRETDGCVCCESLSGMYDYVTDQTSWNREKIKRFLTWFVLRELEENRLLAELGF